MPAFYDIYFATLVVVIHLLVIERLFKMFKAIYIAILLKIQKNNTAKTNALGKHAQNFIDVGNAFVNGD